jgi:crotonobetainyl-CoA:carnitine CoA-transferase CaiB-like acyl-CoA transferase
MLSDEEEATPQAMPLEGIRILELGTFHAGPGASAILGDLGGEVIKIEETAGDPMRTWKEVGGISFSMANGEGLPFQFSNRNKKGICLGLHDPKGREIFHRLIRESDVFLTNLRKSTKTKLGIDYQTLRGINPRIIHASISGFGPEGSLSDAGAFDPMGQARSGMMFVTGSERPSIIHLAVLDQAASITLSHAILTALLVRERRGIGQEVHVSLYSTALWLLYNNLIIASCLSIEPTPSDRFSFSPLRNYFRCKDDKWIIGTHHPEHKYWPLLCEATEQTALLDDPRFSDITKAGEHRRELIEVFDKVFATRTRSEWLASLRERGLMFGPIQRTHDVLTDPQALVNNYVVDFEHPLLGRIKIPGYPAHFSASCAKTRSLGPTLGEHTDLVMRQLGYSDQEVEELKKQGIIKAGLKAS